MTIPPPLETTCSCQLINVNNVSSKGLSDLAIGGFNSADFSKYSLRIKSVFVIDLEDANDEANFDQSKFKYSKGDFKGPLSKANYHLIDLIDYPTYADPTDDGSIAGVIRNLANHAYPPSDSEYVFSDTQIPWSDFLRVVRYALSASGSTAYQHGYYGIVFECVPFITKKISYGSNGKITAVNSMIDYLDTPMGRKYIDAMCSGMSFPLPPEIILIGTQDLEKYADKQTYKYTNPGSTTMGLCQPIANSHEGGVKINIGGDMFYTNADDYNFNKVNSHRSYLSELVFHYRTTPRNSHLTESSVYGGYFVMMINNNPGVTANKYNVFLHELGHALKPHDVNNYFSTNPFMDPKGGHNAANSNPQEVYKKWRGFGNGEISTFDRGLHESPNNTHSVLYYSCPMVYLRGTKILPMPKSNIMAYSELYAQGAGSLYHGADFLGANVPRIQFPILGQVFKYETFCAVVGEKITPSGSITLIEDNEKPFLMFDSNRLISNFELVKETRSFFTKSQILWGGIMPADSTKSPDIDFLSFAKPPRRLQIDRLFYDDKIQYDDFSYTQKLEYEISYADSEAQSYNLDFFKRDKNYATGPQYAEAGNDKLYSHVDDEVLKAIGFEILEDVIEVINGEPRRNYAGDSAKYNYIISKAKGSTESALQQSFGDAVEKDKIINSLWGGRKIAKEMAIENAEGEEECQYVYVVVRDAVSKASFSDKTIEDDKGKSVIIQ